MVEAVEEVVAIGSNEYPGYIQTLLDDVSFLRSVMLQWAQFSKEEVDLILPEDSTGNDAVYRTGGFLVEDDGGTVNFIKIGDGQWVIAGMEFQELESFAEDCEGNLE